VSNRRADFFGVDVQALSTVKVSTSCQPMAIAGATGLKK